MTDTNGIAATPSLKSKKSKTPNVVRATLMVLDEIDTSKIGEELIKKTSLSALELGEAYYSNSKNFNNQVDKTIFFVTLIRDKVSNLRDRYDLLLSGLNFIKDTHQLDDTRPSLESLMSLTEFVEGESGPAIRDKIPATPSNRAYETLSNSDSARDKGQINRDVIKYRVSGAVNPRSSSTSVDKNERQSSRKSEILSHLSDTPQSIKDIASKVLGCSEKTVQRELNSLLEEKVIIRVGEKRWSKYLLA